MWRGKTPARKNLEFIFAGVGLARKKSKFSSPGQGWQEKKSKFSSPGQGWRGKIWFSDPRNSRHTPPRPAMPRKRLYRKKKRRALRKRGLYQVGTTPFFVRTIVSGFHEMFKLNRPTFWFDKVHLYSSHRHTFPIPMIIPYSQKAISLGDVVK